jgi:hypothetical protein
MSTLAFTEEIAPRELRPEVYEPSTGFSRASVEAHLQALSGCVNKRNEILTKLADVDLGSANQVYPEPSRAEGRPDLRARRDQELTVLTSRISAAAAAIPPARSVPSVKRDFGPRRLARGPEGHGHGRPRLGPDCV